MNTVDPSYTRSQKTVCPFCSFGCEFAVLFNDFGIKGVEYLKEGSSDGRLCPRGSAASLYLDHPKRLSMPLKKGKVVDWGRIGKELKKIAENPKSVAVTFDRNITIEEYQSIVDFCEKVGIEHIASTYFEPEAFLNSFFKNPFSIGDIENAQMIIVIGDPFNQAPMTSKALINWKLQDRKNRLVVIDTIGTHTAAFASDFLRCRVGTEPLVLLALAQQRGERAHVSEMSGVPESKIMDIGRGFQDAKNGLIVVSLPFAHTYDPLLLIESLRRLQQVSGKKVVPFVEFAGFEGKQHFGSIIQSIKKKKIKYLINFGELFPFYYPQLAKGLKAVTIYATSPVKFNDYTALPFALNLEKKGSIITSFGKKALDGAVNPPSGARTVADILQQMKPIATKGQSLRAPQVEIDIDTRVEKLAKRVAVTKKKTVTLLGEKIAYNFLAFFENEMIKVNPLDAKDMSIRNHDIVSVKSKHGRVELEAKLTTDVGRGVAAVPVETSKTKGLFDFEIDGDILYFVPTEVEIWQKG